MDHGSATAVLLGRSERSSERLNAFADSGHEGAISSPGSGFEPQAGAFTLDAVARHWRKCQIRTGDSQITGLMLYPLS